MSTKDFHEVASELASRGWLDEIVVGNVETFVSSGTGNKITISPMLFAELQLEAGGPFDRIYNVPVTGWKSQRE